MTAFDGRSDAVSTLVLVSDEEYVLCASRSRVLFDCYSRKEVRVETDRSFSSVSLTPCHANTIDRRVESKQSP
jgi:hypothetical protein